MCSTCLFWISVIQKGEGCQADGGSRPKKGVYVCVCLCEVATVFILRAGHATCVPDRTVCALRARSGWHEIRPFGHPIILYFGAYR